MSKITDLRREATEAVRTRRFDAAVKLYERICGLDGSNPGYRNELGDVHIKMGDIPSGVSNFEKAIELYMAVGLTNNAVAVHKKILRFDPDRLESHWGLGEIRRRQGLDTEASSSFLDFLAQADKINPAAREVFLDRCSILIENMADDLQILSTLEKLYERLDMPGERARVLICKAKLAHESGEVQVASHYLSRAKELAGDLSNVPEYAALEQQLGPELMAASTRRPAESRPAEASGPAAPRERAPQPPLADVESGSASEATTGDHADEPSPDPQEPPHLELELDGETHESQAPAPPEPEIDEPKPVERTSGVVAQLAADPPKSAPVPAAKSDSSAGNFNLLDAILADDGNVDLGRDEQEQVDTIVQDLEGQMGSEVAPDDYKGQYDLGLVFMDMALYPQAVEAFERAAMSDPIRLKALEMKGTCLRRMGRLDEALGSFREGLKVAGHPARHYLGLLYEVGSCLEEQGHASEALDYYGRVVALDAGFLDIQQRLTRVQATRR